MDWTVKAANTTITSRPIPRTIRGLLEEAGCCASLAYPLRRHGTTPKVMLWRNPWRLSRTVGTPVVHSCLQPEHSHSPGKRRVKMRARWIACLALAVLPWQAQAQEVPGRLVLEGGIVGSNSGGCPAHYAGINGRVRGPVSLYGMVENYRCADLAGSANRVGTSVLLGRYRWLVRPAVRTGIEYDGGDVSPTAGASLTLGRRYGARFMVHLGNLSSGKTLVLFQIGGYLSF